MQKLKTISIKKEPVAQRQVLWDVLSGRDGINGLDGLNGKDGQYGIDGKHGTNGVDGKNGKDGLNGRDGRDGKDGRGIAGTRLDNQNLIIIYDDGFEENVGRVVGEDGKNGLDGMNGGIISGSANQPKQGFIDYNDTSTATTPLGLEPDTWISIPNDGQGAFTNTSYSPAGVSKLMDTDTGKIDPRQLNLGDVIIIRNDFTVIPQTNNASLRFRYTLGDGAGSYTLEKRLGRLDECSGIEYRFSLATDKIYMGDTNTRNNLIGLEVALSTTGTLINAGTVISVIRYGG